MAEPYAQTAAGGLIEIVNGEGQMDPLRATYLARDLLACAVAQLSQNAPPVGVIVPDAHIPVMAFAVGESPLTGDISLRLTVPPDLQLSFRLSLETAHAIGLALRNPPGTTLSPGSPDDVVH